MTQVTNKCGFTKTELVCIIMQMLKPRSQQPRLPTVVKKEEQFGQISGLKDQKQSRRVETTPRSRQWLIKRQYLIPRDLGLAGRYVISISFACSCEMFFSSCWSPRLAYRSCHDPVTFCYSEKYEAKSAFATNKWDSFHIEISLGNGEKGRLILE